jgi:4-hydroxy-3-polyprenylbenzoate decarboxylase
MDEKERINLLKPSQVARARRRPLGTGCVVTARIRRFWVNVGVYRVQVFDEKTIAIMISKGKQGAIIMQKYWDRKEPCPVAISFGHDPLTYLVGGMEIQYGTCEYDVCGGIRGEPMEVIEGPKTKLPIPATAEIVIEGELHAGQMVENEGPFGEWTGYYAGGRRPQPKISVTSVLHRNDPIMLGAMPRIPPNDDCTTGDLEKRGCLAELENAGHPRHPGHLA